MKQNQVAELSRCRSLGELLSKRAEKDGSQIFAYYKDFSLTLEEFDKKSDSLANALLQMGVKKGEKVAIISHSNLDYLVCEYAIFKIGAVCVPINCMLKAHEFSYLLDNAEVVLAFIHQKYLREFLSSQLGGRKIPYYVIDSAQSDSNSLSNLLLEDGSSEVRPKTDIGYDNTCCILYTSGTSGMPKGVVYENYGMLPFNGETYVQQMMDVIELGPADTTYLPFALYHVLGQVHIVGALRNGGKIALAEKFSASQFWNDVRRYNATVLVHQGASVPLLLKQPPSDLDRDHSARLSVGAGVASEEVWRAFEERFGVKIFEHYAQTEGAFFGAGTMPTNIVGSIGLPYPTAEIRIVDENDSDVKPGEPGQLISRLKPEVTRRKAPESLYYRDPEKGRSRFTKDGWFRSGDVVRVEEKEDGAGYLYYVGKVETFIRYRGENISPLQIESILSKHPLIDECIAVPFPNREFGGDDVKVVLALKEGSVLQYHELISWCVKNMPKFMIPRYVEVVQELKKTEQTKKIMRNEYRENSDQTWDRLSHQH